MTTKISATKARRKTSSAAVKDYKSALGFLGTFTDYEKMTRVGYNHTTFNLSRMQKILTAVGNPHKGLFAVHIAGTKGKGSTAAMLSHMLANCNLKVGLYTSPHLIDIRERIQVNHELISKGLFAKCLARLAPIARKFPDKNRPTFFELITAVAFMHFAAQKVDVAIVETGLGGRLDSTNVLKPQVCGLTEISFDHTYQLGNTLEKIAAEKAGIFKSGVPIISTPQPKEVRKVFQKIARAAKAPLAFTGEDIEFSCRFESNRDAGPHTRVCLATASSKFEHLAVPLLGEHQAVNCGLALALLAELKEKGLAIDDQLAIEGLAKTELPGRMEIICDDPRVLVDGAHNAASMEALMKAIGQHVPYDSMVLIFGCAADKNIDAMLDHANLGADKVIFTRSNTVRMADPEDLALRFEERTGRMAQTAATLEDALRIAASAVTRGDLICVTGSFYLAGEAKKIFMKLKRSGS